MLTKQNYHHIMLKLKKQVVEERVYEYMLFKKKQLTAICNSCYINCMKIFWECYTLNWNAAKNTVKIILQLINRNCI